MPQRLLSLVAVLCLLVAGCGSKPGEHSSGPTAPSTSKFGPSASRPKSVPTVLILDASGSMTAVDAPGPRIDAAKAAARSLLDALPDDSTLGLQTYGTATGSDPGEKTAGCQDAKILIPVGPVDRTAIRAAIDAITPSGYTPISLALQTAANQLPAGNTPTAIVLVSDGEDTCDTPPCDTAAQLKQAHPRLTISTVGFKVDGIAADQLRCIADATGGLFVQAANSSQLAARLLATQNIDEANTSLSSTGFSGVNLGSSIGDIRSKHADFPGVTGTGSVTVVWRDCDFSFTDGVLNSISPHNAGRTIDGITAGTPVAQAAELYGKPLSATPNNDGTTTVTFDADPATDNAYKMTVDGYADNGGALTGTIKTITLCRCKPRANVKPAGVTDATILNMTFPVGICGNSTRGWVNTAPITVRNGDGEAQTPSGQFAGASIKGAQLFGWLDADGNRTDDAVVTFTCYGSTAAMCCAGRTSMMEFVAVFDFSSPTSPRLIGETIMPGESPIRGKTYGEPRRIDQVRIDDSALITEEKLIYADTSAVTEDLGYPPTATIEVTHRFVNGHWVSSERVIS